MNTCKDCKWWGRLDNYDNNLKYCEKSESFALSEWRKIFSGSEWDDHDHALRLTDNCVTGPDFGCIHWEEK